MEKKSVCINIIKSSINNEESYLFEMHTISKGETPFRWQNGVPSCILDVTQFRLKPKQREENGGKLLPNRKLWESATVLRTSSRFVEPRDAFFQIKSYY